MKKAKKSQIPSETSHPAAERYPGSEVLGMEYTNARPIHWETGANPPVFEPMSHWPEPFCYTAIVKRDKKG